MKPLSKELKFTPTPTVNHHEVKEDVKKYLS